MDQVIGSLPNQKTLKDQANNQEQQEQKKIVQNSVGNSWKQDILSTLRSKSITGREDLRKYSMRQEKAIVLKFPFLIFQSLFRAS